MLPAYAKDSCATNQEHVHGCQITPIDCATLSMTLKFFSPTEIKILTALTDCMVGDNSSDVWKQTYGHKDSIPAYSPTVITIDAFVAGLPLNLQVQLRRALHLFQWCPILFIGRLGPFTRLSRRDADAYIRSWAESRFGLRRRLFRGLRDLMFLGYYSQSAASIYHTSTDEPEGR